MSFLIARQALLKFLLAFCGPMVYLQFSTLFLFLYNFFSDSDSVSLASSDIGCFLTIDALCFCKFSKFTVFFQSEHRFHCYFRFSDIAPFLGVENLRDLPSVSLHALIWVILPTISICSNVQNLFVSVRLRVWLQWMRLIWIHNWNFCGLFIW